MAVTGPGLGRAGPLRRRRHRGFGGWVTTAVKVGLVLAAVGYVALVFNWQRLMAPGLPDDTASEPGGTTDRPLVQVDLVNTRLLGWRDDAAYRVTARTAQRAGPTGHLVALEGPRAEIRRDDGKWARFSADRGVFDRRAQTLRLDGNVKGFTSGGHELAGASLVVDIARATVSTSQTIRGSWPGGAFQASEGGHVGLDAREAALFGDSRVVWTGSNAPPGPLPKPPPTPLGAGT